MSDAAELSPGRTVWEALGDIPGRRGAKGRRYPLRSVLTLSLAAMLAGGNDLCSIFRWGRRLPPEALYLLGLKRAPCQWPCRSRAPLFPERPDESRSASMTQAMITSAAVV